MSHENPEPEALDEPGHPPRSRRRMAVVITAGAVVVVGVVVIALVLAFSSAPGGGAASDASAVSSNSSNSAAPNPAGTTPAGGAGPVASGGPASSATAAPPAPPIGPVIDSFTVDPVTAVCADDRAATVPLTFSWSSTGGAQAWIGIGTTDAQLAPSAEVATSVDGFTEFAFDCFDTEQVYTVTVSDGANATSSSVFVTRELLP